MAVEWTASDGDETMITQAMDGASLSTLRLLQRSLAIVALFLGQGVRWLVGWLILLLAFSGPARRREWFGECLLDLFRHLGATFIKVGQIMSTRPDLVPEHITHALDDAVRNQRGMAQLFGSVQGELGRHRVLHWTLAAAHGAL